MKAVTVVAVGAGLVWFVLDTVRAVVQDYPGLRVWLDHTTFLNVVIFWGLVVVAPTVIISVFCSARGREEEA